MIANDTEMRALLLQEKAALNQRRNAIRAFGLKHYKPHPKQDAFHRAGKFKRRAVFAGNRWGKSDCGAAEDCAQGLGYRPWLLETDSACRAGIPQRSQRILVVTTDWGKVGEIFTSQRGEGGKMWKFLPRDSVKSATTNHARVIELIELHNGSVIQFDTVESFKKNPQSMESSDWDVIHVDEPVPQAMYSACARGLMDRGGQAYFTLTPLREPWIYDMFFGGADVRSAVTRNAATLFKDAYWSVTGSVWDNPYLTAEAINGFLDELPDQEERDCRESGIPLQFAGLIYKEFEPAIHVMSRLPDGWRDYDTPPDDWPIYLQLDPHPQTPVAGLLCTVSPTGRKYVFDEIWHKGTCQTIADVVKTKLGNRRLVSALGDPCLFNVDELTGTCWADDFSAAGLWLDRAQKDLARGIIAVKGALRSRMPDESAEWMFSPYLRRFIWEIKRWHWDKDNKPKDKDDHTLECFYRMVLEGPTWTDNASMPNPCGDLAVNDGLEGDERWSRREYQQMDY